MPAFSIRPLTTHADFRACLALQKETWGDDFMDLVAPSILKVSQRLGGVTAGAFDDRGTLIGFVFGMTGLERGKPVHWSDMLAVRPEARNLGVGRALKEYQRQAVLPLGVQVIYWTFDPLVARNANLNFNVFGVRVVEYVLDMYGETDSVLHRGIGTDRLIVAWDICEDDAARIARRAKKLGGSAVRRIEVPADIHVLQSSDPAKAAEWRRKTRTQFQEAIASGDEVSGFQFDSSGGSGYYVLTSAA